MHRTWLITPFAFIFLLAAGFQNLVSQAFSPESASSASAESGGKSLLVASADTRPSGVITGANGGLTVQRAAGAPNGPVSRAAGLVPVTATPAMPRTPTPVVAKSTPLPAASATSTRAPLPSATATTRPTMPPTATVENAVAPQRTGSEQVPEVTAKEVVVVDGESGAVLYQQAAHRRVAPASTTKILTTLVALANSDPSEMVTAAYDPSELIDSTLMGLRVGDRVTLEDLLYGLMLPSGNDAALAIATHVGGSRQGFADLMNAKVAELGLENSRFANPHGLDEPGHYSSAYDMVQMARVGMRDSRFAALSAARVRTVRVGNRVYDVFNLNRTLGQIDGADGVKIGYTEEAGRTIVASATRNGHRVYVGAFHSSDLVGDSKAMMEWAFQNFTWPDGTGGGAD